MNTATVTPAVDLLLPSDAARLLGVSSATVRNWIYAGKLPALRLSGGVRAIRPVDVERLVGERAREAAR
ncbi:MAG: helix-turn-helix domain-containing protein [Vicinamibacteria bacterium]|nr:helix-turn-helix domain-containing protein [Vicinamibacteria bacterium]